MGLMGRPDGNGMDGFKHPQQSHFKFCSKERERRFTFTDTVTDAFCIGIGKCLFAVVVTSVTRLTGSDIWQPSLKPRRDGRERNINQVAQRHQEVSGTLALPLAVVVKLDVGRAADPIGIDVL